MTGAPRALRPSDRLVGLDAMRGLAVLAVVAFHYTVAFPRFYEAAIPAPFAFRAGYLGVDVFFVISGVVIARSAEGRSARAFAAARAARLYPVAWAATILTAGVLLVLPVLGPAAREGLTPAGVAASLALMHDVARAPPVEGAMWSLTFELGFYALVAGLIGLVGVGDRTLRGLAVLMSVAGAASPLLMPIVPHPLHYVLMTHPYGQLFGAGLAIHLVGRDRRDLTAWAVILAAPVVSGLFAARALALVPVPGAPLYVAGGIALILAAVLRPVRLPALAAHGVRALAWLGTLSYAAYLVHQMIGYTVIAVAQEGGASWGASLAAACAVTLVLAYLLTRVVERPGARALNRLLSPRQRLAPAPAPR